VSANAVTATSPGKQKEACILPASTPLYSSMNGAISSDVRVAEEIRALP